MQLSYEQKRGLVQAAVDPEKEYKVWIKDIFEDKAIVEDGGKLFEVPYTIADGKVTLGERKEVITSYVPFAEMKDVEVLKTGTFVSMAGNVLTFTEQDLEEIEANAKKLADVVKPPLVATHDEGDNASVQVFGSVHGGTLHNIRKVGEKLLADIKGVPKKAAELLAEVGEFRLSPEVYNDFVHDGQSCGKALRRVAWVDIPAIKTMAGVTAANLFEEKPDQPTTWIRLRESEQSKNGKENKMSEKLQEQVNKLSEKNTTLESEIKALKTEKEQAVIKLSEKEKAEKTSKIKDLIKPFRDAGLAPVAAEQIEAFAESLNGSKVLKFGEKESTQVEKFSEVLNSLFKREKDGKLIVQFGEAAPGADKFGEDAEHKKIVDAIASAAPGK